MGRFSLWAIHVGWIASGALVGVVVAIKVVSLILVHGDYIDPFSRYDAILPGNPINVLSSYDCSVTVTRINGRIDPVYFSCAILPQDGYFDIIHVEGRNKEITEVTFYATNVNLGQPLLHWRPLAHPKVTDKSTEWKAGFYSIAVLGTKLNYQVPIRIFTIKGMPKHVN